MSNIRVNGNKMLGFRVMFHFLNVILFLYSLFIKDNIQWMLSLGRPNYSTVGRVSSLHVAHPNLIPGIKHQPEHQQNDL